MSKRRVVGSILAACVLAVGSLAAANEQAEAEAVAAAESWLKLVDDSDGSVDMQMCRMRLHA